MIFPFILDRQKVLQVHPHRTVRLNVQPSWECLHLKSGSEWCLIQSNDSLLENCWLQWECYYWHSLSVPGVLEFTPGARRPLETMLGPDGDREDFEDIGFPWAYSLHQAGGGWAPVLCKAPSQVGSMVTLPGGQVRPCTLILLIRISVQS